MQHFPLVIIVGHWQSMDKKLIIAVSFPFQKLNKTIETMQNRKEKVAKKNHNCPLFDDDNDDNDNDYDIDE